MATKMREYIGSRYVPQFGRKDEESIAWDNSKPYEPLTIVLHEGNSYTSRQFVPAGIGIDNEAFWALTGNYNAQVEAYRQEVQRFSDDIVEKAFAFDTVSAMKESDNLYVGAICHTNGFHASGDGGAAWYVISDVGTANNKDIIPCGVLFAHFIPMNAFITPSMIGAIGDGIDDDYDYLVKAIQIAETYKINFLIDKKYAFSEKITISNSINVKSNEDSALIYIGNENTGYAITFNEINFCEIEINLENKEINLYGIGGIEIKNSFRNTFKLRIKNFSTGLHILGDDNDCLYNTIYPVYLVDNKVNMHFEALNQNGSVNQNTIIGGSIRENSNVYNLLNEGDVFNPLIIDYNNNAHIPNNNTFISVSFEGMENDEIAINGNNMMLINCRTEGISEFTSNGFSNIIIGGYGWNIIPEQNSDIARTEITRDTIHFPVESNAFEIQQLTGNTDFIEFKTSTGTTLSKINNKGCLRFASSAQRILLDADSHGSPTMIAGSTNEISTSDFGNSSILLLWSNDNTGKRFKINEGSVWKNVLYEYDSATRPTGVNKGYMMFDNNLNKPIWYAGSNTWVDATGTTV